MRVDTCLLCDAVTDREGLLHILGGGIRRTIRPEYPAPLEMSLALRILVHPTEVAHPHQLEVLLQDEDGQQVVKLDMEIDAGNAERFEPGEEAVLLIPWNFPGRPELPNPGRYSFELLIDRIHQVTVPFTAELPNQKGGESEDAE